MIFKLSYENLNENIILPVNPSEFIISNGGTSFTDVQVIKGGERTVIGNRQMQVVSFSSFFPKFYDSSYCTEKSIFKPWELVKKIDAWRQAGEIVKLLITEADINMYATIRKFDYREKGGEPGDIYYDIEFKEFEFIRIREIGTESAKVEQQSNRPETSGTTKSYTVQEGDCLWSIAKKFYGTGSEYEKIFNLNSPPIKNANLIYPGQVLMIP